MGIFFLESGANLAKEKWSMSLSLLSPSLRVEPAVSLLLPLPLVLAVAEALGPEALGAAEAALPLFPAGFLAGAAAAFFSL